MLRAGLMRKKTGYPHLWIALIAFMLEGESPETEDGLINSLKGKKGSRGAEHDDMHIEQRGLVDAQDGPISTNRMRTHGGLHEFLTMSAKDGFQHGLFTRRMADVAAVHCFSQLAFDERQVIVHSGI